MSGLLENKNAIIYGPASGIGREVRGVSGN
jgi:hypothetical protein